VSGPDGRAAVDEGGAGDEEGVDEWWWRRRDGVVTGTDEGTLTADDEGAGAADEDEDGVTGTGEADPESGVEDVQAASSVAAETTSRQARGARPPMSPRIP